MSDIQDSTVRIKVDSSEGEARLAAFGAKLKELAAGNKQAFGVGITDPAKQATDAIVDLGKRTEQHIGGGFKHAFEKAKVSVEGLVGSLEKGVIAIGIEEAVRKSIVAWAGYEREMERIKLVNNMTTHQINELGEVFNDLRAKTGESMEEIITHFQKFQATSGKAAADAAHDYEQVVIAARAAGVGIETMAAEAGAAVHNLGVSTKDLPDVLSSWAKDIPRMMHVPFAQGVARITDAMEHVGVSGKKAAIELGVVFGDIAAAVGQPRRAAAALQETFDQMGDPSGPMGQMMAKPLEQIRRDGGGVIDVMHALVAGMKEANAFDGDKTTQLMWEQKFKLPPGTVRVLQEYLKHQKEIDAKAKDIGHSINFVKDANEQFAHDAQASFEKLSAALGTVEESVGKMLDKLGSSTALEWLAKQIDQIGKGAENIHKIIENIGEGHNPLAGFSGYGLETGSQKEKTILDRIRRQNAGKGKFGGETDSLGEGLPDASPAAPSGQAHHFIDSPAGYGPFSPKTGGLNDFLSDSEESKNIEDRRAGEETVDAQNMTVQELKRLNANLEEMMGKGAGGTGAGGAQFFAGSGGVGGSGVGAASGGGGPGYGMPGGAGGGPNRQLGGHGTSYGRGSGSSGGQNSNPAANPMGNLGPSAPSKWHRSGQAGMGPPAGGEQGMGALADQSNRPAYYGGTVDVGGQTFNYGTGGGGRGSMPYGSFPINIGQGDIGPIGQRIGSVATVGGTGGEINDPKYPGAPREGVQIHPSSGRDLDHLYTQGCFGVPRAQWPAFKQALLDEAAKNPQGLRLSIGRDGKATIGGRQIAPTVADAKKAGVEAGPQVDKATPVGGGIDRSGLQSQMGDQTVRRMAGLTKGEVGLGDKNKAQTFAATHLNRTMIESGNVNRQMDNGYYPGTQNTQVSDAEFEDYKKTIHDPVMAGAGGDFTHNASNAPGNPVAANAERLYPGQGQWVGDKNKEYFYRKGQREANKIAGLPRNADATSDVAGPGAGSNQSFGTAGASGRASWARRRGAADDGHGGEAAGKNLGGGGEKAAGKNLGPSSDHLDEHRSLMQLQRIKREMSKPIDLNVKGPSPSQSRRLGRQHARNQQQDVTREARNRSTADVGFA